MAETDNVWDHKGKRYWSRLRRAYEEKLTWPPGTMADNSVKEE